MRNQIRLQRREKREENKQTGFVSIFTVLIIMALLSLVAIGFLSVTRQAQRRTLDAQLNSQAFYAAESGVNDAIIAIAKTPGYTKKQCTGQDPENSFKYTLDSSLSVGYTCVLINATPTDIVVSSVPVVGSSNPKVYTVQTTSGNAITSFDIQWDGTGNDAGNSDIPNYGNFPKILPQASDWGNKLGVLKIDLVPTDSSFDRQILATSAYSFYLYPSQNGTRTSPVIISNGTANQAELVWVKCAGARSPCKTTIQLNATVGSLATRYAFRVQSMYNSTQITMSNLKSSAGSETFSNGQALIDVTGKANDVLRRIQVRRPVNTNGLTPAFGILSAESICKRLQTLPNNTLVDGSTGVLGTQSGDFIPGGACSIPTTVNP